MEENHANKSDRILRMPDVRQKTGLAESTIHDITKRGLFPAPFLLIPGGRATGRLESQIDQWILERKEASEKSL